MTDWEKPSSADEKKLCLQEIFESGQRNHHISNTAYPIAHSQTWKPYRIGKQKYEQTISGAFSELPQIALYSHIPFCESRCYFCEYTVVGKSELHLTERYMQSLDQELALYSSILGPRELIGFDIGGGTPSFVDARLIDRHIQSVQNYFSLTEGFGISIETTPKIAASDPQKIREYQASGIRRISMGIQVTQPDLLKILGRDANGTEQLDRAVENIRDAQFDRLNIDLMYGFAKQSLASWEATLKYAIKLNPEYITLYRMRYKLTRISDQASQVDLDQVIVQSRMAKEMLTSAGYWSNPGKNTFSKIANDTGTSAYLTSRVIQGSPYLGIGLGAQSFTNCTISYNSGAIGKNLAPYFSALGCSELPIQDLYLLPRIQVMAKMVAVSFYFGEVNLSYFQAKFGIAFEEAYGDAVEFALKNGLMQYTDSKNGMEFRCNSNQHYGLHCSRCLSLTEKGAESFNGTIALFFAPSVQAYLIERDPTTAEDMHMNQRFAERIVSRSCQDGS